MTNSMRFRKAHKNTREAVAENSSLNYRVQFGLELSALYSVNEMKSELELMREKKIQALKEKWNQITLTTGEHRLLDEADILMNYSDELDFDFEGTIKNTYWNKNGYIENAIEKVYGAMKV